MDMDDVMQLRSCSIKSSLAHLIELFGISDIFWNLWMFSVAEGNMLNKNPATHNMMHLQEFAKEEEPRIAAVVALQGAQKSTALYYYVALHQAASPAMKNATKNAAAVFAYKIIDDSILSSCMPEDWPEISIEVSWQAAEEAVSISAAIATGSKGNWFMLILILGQLATPEK